MMASKEKPFDETEKELPSRRNDPSSPPVQDPTGVPYKAPPEKEKQPHTVAGQKHRGTDDRDT